MASIYKRNKADRKAPWYIAYTENGRRKVVKGCTDYKASLEIAGKLEADAARRKRGVIGADEVRYADENRRELTEHVKEYLAACEHERQSSVHVANKTAQLNLLLANTNAKRLSDLHADSVGAHLESIRRRGKGNSARTVNQHRTTAVSFLEWCKDRGRLPINPLEGKLTALDERQDRKRVRRAMTIEELTQLLATAGKRKPVYLLAALAGLRRSELAALRWGDIDLEKAILRVRAEVSKSGREDEIPLHADAVIELRAIMPAKAKPDQTVFKAIPRVTTFHRDCQRARASWIKEAKNDPTEFDRRQRSTFLSRFDSERRQLDLHGLRTTLGTMLARSGATPQLARLVMRHSDVRITMKHYTDLRLHDAAGAVDMLPRLCKPDQPNTEAPAMAKTGTHDTAEQCVAPLIAPTSPNDAKACAADQPALRLVGEVAEVAKAHNPAYSSGRCNDLRDDAKADIVGSITRETTANLGAVGAVG